MDNISADAQVDTSSQSLEPIADSGLAALAAIAEFYRIAVRPETMAREFVLKGHASSGDLQRAAKSIGLKSRIVDVRDEQRLQTLPSPAIACLEDGGFAIFGGKTGTDGFRLVHPVDFTSREIDGAKLLQITPAISVHLRPVAHHQPDRRRTRTTAVPASAQPSAELFRDQGSRADGCANART